VPARRGGRRWCCLPEIALTAEFLTRVEARFGAKPPKWHSGVTMTERRRCWKMLGQGEAQLVVGARSALFLPFRDLGLIVVDEEHDSSYKQEEGALYNARDMAVLRASPERRAGGAGLGHAVAGDLGQRRGGKYTRST
jgi:primosomal protein N' (replication factor Y)